MSPYQDSINQKRAEATEKQEKQASIDAIENLSKSIKTLLDSLETTGVKKLDKEYIDSVKRLESVLSTISSIKVTSDNDIKKALRSLAIAFNNLDVKPTVEVQPAEVVVHERKIDFTPVIKALDKIKQSAPVVNVDIATLDESIKEVKKAISGLSFPTANFILPFKDPTTGKATQVVLTSDGKLPVDGGGGSGGAVTVADGADEALGAKDDAVASSDTGTFSLISLTKRINQWLTTANGYLASLVSGQQSDALTDSELRASPVEVDTGLTQPTTPSDTQPVSAASLPLPSGAATSAKQDTVIGHIDGLEAAFTTLNANDFATEAKQDDIITAIAAIPGGGGAQYTEGDTDATPTGTAILWKDSANSDALVAPSFDNPMPVRDDQVATNTVDIPSMAAGVDALADTVLPEDVEVPDGQYLVMAGVTRKDTPANTSGTDGDAETLQVADGRLWTSAKIDTELPAGNNNIGDVDVASIPVAFNSGATSATTQRVITATDAGAAGRLAANSGVDIGDVDVTSAVSATLDHGSNRDIDTSAEQITSTSFACKFGVTIKSDIANTGIVYIGNSDVTAGTTAATDGFPLSPGESLTLEVTNSNIPYAIASANNQVVYWAAV